MLMVFFSDLSAEMPFHLVFLIRLRYVIKRQTLVDIIRKQHDLKCSPEYVESILYGKTKHRVLLMLDGYNEYKPGTNIEIDKAIELGIGNCSVIVTSQPGYLRREIHDQMDVEIQIEGFTEDKIEETVTKYLGSFQKSAEMLKQAKHAGIYDLLRIPIMLVMAVVIFAEKESLPKSKTSLYETIFRLTMDRTTLKTFDCKSSDIAKLGDLLYILGEFSWKALQHDTQPLLLKEV